MMKLVPALLLVAQTAFAQTGDIPIILATQGDSDADGVVDAQDAAPCEHRVSAWIFAPAEQTYGMMLFEDQWPATGDFDFNDVVLAYNEALGYASDGRLTKLRLDVSVLAVGAHQRNGLGFRLPGVDPEDVTSLVLSIDGRPVPVEPRAGESDLVLVLAEDVHALFGVGHPSEFVNTDPTQPRRPYASLALEIEIDPGHGLSAADAPFDLFIFDPARGAEIHRPRYRGTAALNSSLVGTADDGTDSERAFVSRNGIPFALELPELADYPFEGERIDALYPGIVDFGATHGTGSTQFYRTPRPGHGFGLVPPAPLAASASPNLACLTPEPGVCGSAVGTGHLNAPSAGLCDVGTPSGVSSSGGSFRWTCEGLYSTPTPCSAPDWICQPNVSGACAITGGTGVRACNGSGTGYGSCVATSCNAGFYLSGGSCHVQVCTPGSSTGCTVSNGSGQQACNTLGSAWAACAPSTCNSGFRLEGHQCVANTPVSFDYTGSAQSYRIPSSGRYRIEVWGATGGGARGGNGGYASGVAELSQGTDLYIYVGEMPAGLTGGWNGGGSSGTYGGYHGRGGGGASDVRMGGTSLGHRVIVAGGGGGGAGHVGGHGGGANGNNGGCGRYSYVYCGGGGTRSGGGRAGTRYGCGSSQYGHAGTLGQGGDGGRSASTSWGDGGGGGYYGGGGAGGACTGSFSGGGGSGYIAPMFESPVTQSGVRAGHGWVRITPLD